MKKNILRNIRLDANEKVYKHFKKINAKGHYCEIMLTTRRLIVYSFRKAFTLGNRTKHKRMNEIDLKTIKQLEYGVISKKSHWVSIIGLLIFLGSLGLAYFFYMGRVHLPSLVPFQPYSKYIIAGIVGFVGLLMLFIRKRSLYLKISSNINDRNKETIEFAANKYNELAIRYLASKIHP